MTKKFYYIRDIERKPIITVCLIREGDEIGKGIAICSQDDIPEREVGREWAEYYADLALERKTNSEYTSKEGALITVENAMCAMTHELSIPVYFDFDDEFCQSLYNPTLSRREMRMLRIPIC